MAYIDEANNHGQGWQAHRVVDDVPDMPVLDLGSDEPLVIFPVDKRTQRIRFIDETEDSVTIVVEKKECVP